MRARETKTLLPPQGWLAFIVWGLFFAIAYSQSPLYTSNQNQYFLHGLANAGYGDLSQDWLANTLDPTPAFSALVEISYRLLSWEGIFYLYYAALMGMYVYALWQIADELFNLRASRAKSMLFLAAFITVHSAGWRFALSRAIGVNWTYLLEDGVADQRLLGPVLQPSAFGVFLLLSIALYIHRKPFWAAVAAAAAAIFHPTYLLSSAGLTLAYMVNALLPLDDPTDSAARRVRRAMGIGLLALIAVTPVLVSSYAVFAGGGDEAARQAREVLVSYRIPHHAVVSTWFDATAVIKILLVAAALTLMLRYKDLTTKTPRHEEIWVSRTKLILIILFPAAVAVILTLLQVLLDSDALALLFPWRISTFLVPLASAVILGAGVDRVMELPGLQPVSAQRRILTGGYLLVGLAVLVGAIRFSLDLERKSHEAEGGVMAYAEAQLSLGDTTLIPLKMQDFRLETGSPAFIDFKAIPYQPEEVLEWQRRVSLADRYYKSGDCAILDQILIEYPLTYVITETGQEAANCPHLERVYSDSGYLMLRVR